MSDTKCHIVKDLIPLYIDDLLSIESKIDIEKHLKTCDDCKKYLNLIKEDSNLDIEISDVELDGSGEKIIKKIKKSQDRLKYTFIIFSIIVAISSCTVNKGLVSTIPLTIIIPFIIRLFFKENKIVFITAIITLLIVGLIIGDIGYILFLSPLVLIWIASGLALGSSVKIIRNRRE